jgi:predicted ATPase/class 3 adenylate cyclase
MNLLPSGIVTFLFTDIEGSTKLAQEHPEKWESLRARHHAILQSAMDSNHGYVFQIIGDAFCVGFHTALDGLNAAIEAQYHLQSENWGETPIKVRMGLHTGEAVAQAGIYTGYLTLSLVQRIMSAGHGMQILLSGSTRQLVQDFLPEATDLLDLGERRLKNILHAERLYQVCVWGLCTTFPPLRTLDSFPNNLPVQITSFVGRKKEIYDVKRALTHHHLVTLVGTGGTGKTRLSLQVAADLLDHVEHGIWFVELAPLTDPELIPQTILTAIGIQDQAGNSPLEFLKSYLRDKHTLIIFDNCEHLIAACAKTAEALLNVASHLNILASSREALGVKGEKTYHVPTLSLPDPKQASDLEQLSQYEAVRLFIDRALLVSPDFNVDKDNAPYIAQICFHLDGIPLALELAAARTRMMSVEQICRRLDDRFRLLTSSVRTALPHQQTLRAMIDWSYDLLAENERSLLCRLAVFAGGWTLMAAEEVCAGVERDTDLGLSEGTRSPYDLLDLLTQLVNKSLVVVTEHSQSGELRYRMLETIRQYAREKLRETGSREVIRDRHLAYYVKLAEQAGPELFRSKQVLWRNILADELDNMRAALEWSLATQVKSGLQLIVATRLFWATRGDITEVDNWLAQLLERYQEPDSLHVQAMVTYCLSLRQQGNLEEARRIAEQSVELARSIPDKQSEAFSLLGLGAVILTQGDFRKGTPVVEQSLALYTSLGDKFGQATALEWLYINKNNLELSKTYVLESLKLHRELDNLFGVALCLSELAHRTVWGGDYSLPEQWLQEAQTIYRQLGDPSGEAWVWQKIGTLAYWQGDYEQSCTCYEESIRLGEISGNYTNNLWARTNLAYALLRAGEILKAKELFELSARRFQKATNLIGLAYVMEGMASLYAHQIQAERAMQLFSWADGIREQIDDHRQPVEQVSVDRDLSDISTQINAATLEIARASGRKMSVEQAIALAFEPNNVRISPRA